MKIQMNGKWARTFWRIHPDHDLSSGLRDRDLNVLNMEHGWALAVISITFSKVIILVLVTLTRACWVGEAVRSGIFAELFKR